MSPRSRAHQGPVRVRQIRCIVVWDHIRARDDIVKALEASQDKAQALLERTHETVVRSQDAVRRAQQLLDECRRLRGLSRRVRNSLPD